MGVLSKLTSALVPKTLSGFFFCLLPLAAAVIVVAYPRALIKLFSPEDPEKLIEEITSTNKTKKKRNRVPKPKTKTDTADVKVVVSETIEYEEEVEASEKEIDEEDLIKLVSNTQSKLSVSNKKNKAPMSPGLSNISLSQQADKIEDSSEEGWSRIPTKEEEALSNFKNKVLTLTRQLEDALKENTEGKVMLEKEQKRASEAEKELKDRSRAFQVRWVEMESEIATLRTSKAELLNQLAEFESVKGTAALVEEQNVKIIQLLSQIATLEDTLLNRDGIEQTLRKELDFTKGKLQDELKLYQKESMANSALKLDIETIQKELSHVKRELDSKVKDEQSSQALIASLKASLIEEKNSKDSLIKSIKSELDSKLSKVEDDKQSAFAELDEIKIFCAKLEEKNKDLISTNQLLDSKIRELQLQLQQQEDRSDKATAELNNLLDLSNEEKKQLKIEIDILKGENSSLRTQISEKDNPMKKEEEEDSEVKKALQESQNERFLLASNLEQVEDRVKELEKLLAHEEKKAGVLKSVSELKYAKFQEEIDLLRLEKNTLTARVNELEGLSAN